MSSVEKDWKITNEQVFPKGDNPLENRFYGYRKLFIDLPNGEKATYDGVIVEPCAHIVAIEDDLTTYLVSQKRPNVTPIGGTAIQTTLELPGGFTSPELSVPESASKELAEELGRAAGKLTQVGVIWPSTGVSNELDHIFVAEDLRITSHSRSERYETTEQDMGVVSGKFGALYDSFRRSEQPVSSQTLAAFSLAEYYISH